MEYLNLHLIATCAIFSGFGTIQQKHLEYANTFNSESLFLRQTLAISSRLQNFSGLLVLIYFFTKTSIIPTLILGASSIILSPIIHIFVIQKIFGMRTSSILGIFLWPTLCIYIYTIIDSI